MKRYTDNFIITYGLNARQLDSLQAAVSERYEVTNTDCLTDLIITNAVCTVVDTSALRKDGLRTLLAYYMDVGKRLDETVVWLGYTDFPDLQSFVRCNSFLDLLTDLDSVITRAKDRYDTMQMYGSEYGFLPKHAIQESMEADVYANLQRKYGDNLDAQIVAQVRRQWQAVLEEGSAEELAAVYELTRWLKGHSYYYELRCITPFPIILQLFDITGNDLKCTSSEISYTFIFPQCLETQMNQWWEHHWLNKLDAVNYQHTIRFIFTD